ncbi:MFS transporter [Chromobacterium piscinae]|uniref:MFS transporter n=1 Tax=Chromobacterium piscinae TaxID=686831 RepID=UPI001E5AC768|nr:MFS transporter [Chromobacterium piscinae]MCD4504699.1 MFS transporter [Chromobacterium piscinae]
MTDSPRSARPFRRDGPTWFLYLVLAVFGFQQSVLGSTLPFLRAEFGYDPIQVGWHFTSYAGGLVASGLLGGGLLPRLGLGPLVRGAAVAMVLAVLSITQARGFAGTLAAAIAMGLTGGVLQSAVQAGLAWHQAEHRDMAMVEAFIFAGAGVFSGPLLVGQLAAAGIPWRWTLLAAALVLALVLPLPAPAGRPAPAAGSNKSSRGGVPLAVALCWGSVLLGIGAEWGIGFWGAQFLESRLGLGPAQAVSLMSVFFGGTVFGRIVSSRLLVRFDGRNMLMAVILLGGGAILALWASSLPSATIAALALAGMCLGNFFPLLISNAIRLEPDHVGLISVGATQAVGVSLLVVPIALGYIGQVAGLVNAIGMLVILPLLMAAACLAAGYRHALPHKA